LGKLGERRERRTEERLPGGEPGRSFFKGIRKRCKNHRKYLRRKNRRTSRSKRERGIAQEASFGFSRSAKSGVDR